MAASADRSTPYRGPEGGMRRRRFPQKGSTTIYKGTIVMILAGYLAPGADTSGGLVVGVAEETSTNSGADGAAFVNVVCGASFRFAGSSIVAADVGKTCYVADDVTVADSDPGNSVVAGVVDELETTDVVWVRIEGKVA
jgi:hypothetical protein